MSTRRREAILAVVSLAASRLLAQEGGRRCWIGKFNGRDLYVSCGSKIGATTVTQSDWITIDLSNVAGFRVTLPQATKYVSVADVINALDEVADSAKR